MAITLYGFKSCDMVRNARKWLDENGVDYDYYDYRSQKLEPRIVDGWFKRAGWENVFNRNSTSFKELPEDQKNGITEQRAKEMILANTNLIKRPVLDTGNQIVLGFKPATFAAALGR